MPQTWCGGLITCTDTAHPSRNFYNFVLAGYSLRQQQCVSLKQMIVRACGYGDSNNTSLRSSAVVVTLTRVW